MAGAVWMAVNGYAVFGFGNAMQPWRLGIKTLAEAREVLKYAKRYGQNKPYKIVRIHP